MSSLLALLSQQTPNLRTRKALILLGLQNDFLSADGKLPVSDESRFLDNLKGLVSEFREFGDVIWVRSEFEASREASDLDGDGCCIITSATEAARKAAAESSATDSERNFSPTSKKRKATSESGDMRAETTAQFEDGTGSCHMEAQQKSKEEIPANGDDEELFLSKTCTRDPCCIPGTPGAEYATQIKLLVDSKKDMQLVKTYYSAFSYTSLLLTLRSKLITELFVCGCNTNLSVYATAVDAARFGIKITLIGDCLGYRKRDRHDLAVKRLVEIMGADVMTSKQVVDILRNPPADEYSDAGDEAEGLGLAESTSGKNLLELTSEEEDDDDDDYDESILPLVRPLRLASRRLEVPSSCPGNAHLPVAGAKGEYSTSPRHATSTSAGSLKGQLLNPVENCRSGREGGVERRAAKDSHGVEPAVTSGPCDRSLAENESSASDKEGQPWPSLIPSVTPSLEDSRSALASGSEHRGLAPLSVIARPDQKTAANCEALVKHAPDKNRAADARKDGVEPLFGAGKAPESEGSRMFHNFLPQPLADQVFDQLKDEVKWQKMLHQTGEVPRLVCCQADSGEDGSMPVYRHPSDKAMLARSWNPVVDQIRQAAEEVIGHPLNHALIQLYRNGNDYISEHSDKTLDIVGGSNIVNVSFGAQRTMRLRTKRVATTADFATPANRTTYRIPMPHNSMIAMSLLTNAKYLHGINADRRPAIELSGAEKAYGGHRISLTFRHIGTFLSADSRLIWGLGAVGKKKDEARPVINGNPEESVRLVQAFGAENQATSFDWEAVYGMGCDILDLK